MIKVENAWKQIRRGKLWISEIAKIVVLNILQKGIGKSIVVVSVDLRRGIEIIRE